MKIKFKDIDDLDEVHCLVAIGNVQTYAQNDKFHCLVAIGNVQTYAQNDKFSYVRATAKRVKF